MATMLQNSLQAQSWFSTKSESTYFSVWEKVSFAQKVIMLQIHQKLGVIIGRYVSSLWEFQL